MNNIIMAAYGAAAQAHELGFAGLLSGSNKEDLPPITLASGKPLAEGPMMLKSGTAYQIDIVAAGSAELGLRGAEFFRAIWINEIMVNGLEIRPLGLDSVEFDDAGTMEVEFIAIKPGQYFLEIPGSRDDSPRVEITIQ